jgi:hypothetical protein
MKREAVESCLMQRAAHEVRAAAIRLARERAEEDADPAVSYGCVDWFRYDLSPPRQAGDRAAPLAAGRRDDAQDAASPGH